MRKDFLASHLRSLINALKTILKNLEEDGHIEENYVNESLKKAEKNLHQLGKLCLAG
jgi:mannitol/fructose-specific phosphotransferase system IIA component